MQHRTARDIRHRNRFSVLKAVYAADGRISRQEIAAVTDLSFASVGNLIGELLDVGVLAEQSRDGAGIGRPAAQIAINPDRGLLVGIDIAETAIHVDLFDLAMSVRRSVEVPVDPAATKPADIADLTARAVTEAVGADGDRVLGVGVSLPGPVDPLAGVSLFSPHWSWRRVPFCHLLAQRLPYRLYLENPLKASTIAELWFGEGGEVDDMVVVTLRAGVGVGIAVDGTLHRGVSNTAGEWGHTVLVPGGRRCECGRRGCVEAYLGAPGIEATLRELAPSSPLFGADPLATVAAMAARTGDPTVREVIDYTGELLGIAVSTLVNLINPRMIVFGDLVAEHLGEPLLAVARRVVAEQALPDPLDAVTLRLSRLHNPVSLGAATFALEHFLADREIFGSVSARRAGRATQ